MTLAILMELCRLGPLFKLIEAAHKVGAATTRIYVLFVRHKVLSLPFCCTTHACAPQRGLGGRDNEMERPSGYKA